MSEQFVFNDEAEWYGWVKTEKSVQSIERLPGDASNRRYYRCIIGGESFILMQLSPFPQEREQLPFLAVQKYLHTSGVDVPEIIDFDPDRGLIFLEDLGDTTLLRKLETAHSPGSESVLYKKVIDALVHLHIYASPQENTLLQEFMNHRFDFEKLMWEVRFTIENFYRLYLKRNFTSEHYECLIKGFGEICQIIANQPTVFTHRDFHSRNIMFSKKGQYSERCVIIDFQDARMGPPQYDLASLLKDSYYQLEPEQVSSLVHYYVDRFEELKQVPINREEFFTIFDLMSVQRNFKAMGSFASFFNQRGDATYIKYIGNTFENIRKTLMKYPQYADLKSVLFNYYYF